MKVINKLLQRQYEEMVQRVEEQKPQAITLKKHPDESKPLTLKNGVVVMAGHYYSEDEGIVIHPDDISKTGTWEEI